MECLKVNILFKIPLNSVTQVRVAVVKVIVIKIFVILLLGFQGQSAYLKLILRVGNNLLEGSILG
jgi:hypothetical protein